MWSQDSIDCSWLCSSFSPGNIFLIHLEMNALNQSENPKEATLPLSGLIEPQWPIVH